MKRSVTLLAFALAILCASTGAMADNTVAVTAQAALNGTNFGLSVNLDGSNTLAYVSSDHPNQEKVYRARFWIDQRNLQIPEGTAGTNHIRFFIGVDQEGAGQHLVGFLTKSDDDHNFHFIVWAESDTPNDFKNGGNIFLGGQPRQVEVEWAAASAPSADDGFVQITRVDNPAQTDGRSDLDNDTIEMDRFRIGVFANPVALTDFYYMDEFESFRTLAP